MTPDPTLNAELGKLLGATPAREWRVRMPDGELRWAHHGTDAKFYAGMMGGEAVLAELYAAYDRDRDLMAGVEEELERLGLAEEYAAKLYDLLADEAAAKDSDDDDWFMLIHAPPDLRARAARDVLKAGER